MAPGINAGEAKDGSTQKTVRRPSRALRDLPQSPLAKLGTAGSLARTGVGNERSAVPGGLRFVDWNLIPLSADRDRLAREPSEQSPLVGQTSSA